MAAAALARPLDDKMTMILVKPSQEKMACFNDIPLHRPMGPRSRAIIISPLASQRITLLLIINAYLLGTEKLGVEEAT